MKYFKSLYPAQQSAKARLRMRRSFLSTTLSQISMAWKITLMTFVFLLGMTGIAASAYSGLQSLRYHIYNIYDFMLIPIIALGEADTALGNVAANLDALSHSENSTPSAGAIIIEQIDAHESQAYNVIDRYSTEWITTLSPDFTAQLRVAGRIDLQEQELEEFEHMKLILEEYRTLEEEYYKSIQTGKPDHALLETTLQHLDEAREHLQVLININKQFADISNQQTQAEYRQALLNGSIALGIALALGLTVSLFIVVSITKRLGDLTRSASAMQQGNLDQSVEVWGRDELSLLGSTFNHMASQLKDLYGTLEERVADRTKALATSTEVSRRLSTILDERQLIIEVVEQVKAAFDYYHVHIYLLDEVSGDLIMAGGTGDVGAAMLKRGHRISHGEGLVGQAAETINPELVADTYQDPDLLPNPLLPQTSSEAAMPIAISGKLLGVLYVQHHQVGGLRQTDLDLLQLIANQVAIALLNARSYTAVRQHAEREARIASIGQKIQTTTSIESALQVAIRELGQTLGANDIRVILEASNLVQNSRKSS